MSFRPVEFIWSRFVNKWNNHGGDFYSCIKWSLLSYRYFSVFPIALSEENNHSFKWTSPYMIFMNMPFVIFQAIAACFHCFDTIYIGFTFPTVSLAVNYTCGLVSSLLIMKLGKDFKELYQKIISIERKLPPIKKNSRVVQSLPVILILGFFLTLVRSILNIMYLYHMATHCTPLDDESVIKTYFDLIFVSIFRYIDFSYIAAVILQIVKIQNVLLATLNNVLLITCSAYLENRFNNLNNIISAEQEDKAAFMDWHQIREHYVQLTKLVKIIDRKVNPIVFLSYFSDLYNLCLQLYYVVSKKSYYYLVNYSDCLQGQSGHLQTKFYKPFAALLTLSKMVAVSIVCARLYTSSRRPLCCLRTVPRAAYNDDAQRFMEQVYHSKMAFSGFEFFYITSEMIISVLGILVTYELVLIQLKS